MHQKFSKMKQLKLIANNGTRKKLKYDIFGISEAFNHALEWQSRGADSMIKRDVSPALRATDYKCPKYVWYNETNMNEDKKTKVAMTLDECKRAKMHEQSRRVYDIDGIAPTQHCNGGGNLELKIVEPAFRIRKLTPRECFRLMDVDDKDIDTIQAAGISDSQQYKLAGNSIVVNVLTEIFRKLLVDTHNDDRQLRMF